MKSDPYVQRKVAAELNVSLSDCVFVGDSVTDVLAANAVDLPSVGYANKHGKSTALANAGAGIVISSLEPLYVAVAGRGRTWGLA